MCEVLGVARSSYYNHLHKEPSNREIENKNIEKEIINIHSTSKNRYGAPKINKSLNILGIRSLIVKKYRPTSSKNKIMEQENILKRDYTANGSMSIS